MNKKYYECFSKRLFGFLTYKGFNYIRWYEHNITKVRCYVYEMTPALSQALKEWKETNPNK